MDSKVVRADFGSGLIRPKGSNMHGLKCGSCRFWQRTDWPRAQTCMDSKVSRADFGSGVICPRAQTCMDSKVVRAVFWQRTDLPPGSNMLRLAYADSGSACKLAGVQIIPLPTLANQILVRTFFRSVANLFARPRGWKVLSGEFRRRPTALAIKFSKSDRVGRRGLSEPREDFSRLLTFAFPWLCPWLDSVALRAVDARVRL